MTDVYIALGGFGSQGWGVAPWGEGGNSVTASGQVGSVVLTGDATVFATGVSCSGVVGDVVIRSNSQVILTGVSCSTTLESVTIWISVNDFQDENWAVIDDGNSPSWVVVPDSQASNWAEVLT